jgi:hypothetical protein
MPVVRRLVFVAALAAAGVWIYAIAGSGAKLLTLFDGFDDATAVARVAVDRAPLEPDAAKEEPAQAVSAGREAFAAPAAESASALSPQHSSADDLSAARIMLLLKDEIASDTDPAAADELLRAFGESLDTQE